VSSFVSFIKVFVRSQGSFAGSRRLFHGKVKKF
jgi:hypothetical protein